MLIIGITGTLGAGKGTIVKYLIDKYGFKHFSVRDYLKKKALDRGILTPDRDIFTKIANELREQHSPSFIVDELFLQAIREGNNAIIESIRSPGEIASLQKKGEFVLLAIDALPEIRYKRIRERKSETDDISFDTFIQNEQREMQSENLYHQNLSACINQADFIIENNGTVRELQHRIDLIFEQLNCHHEN